MLKIKRIYLPPAKDDGERILVERLWPRGMTKEKAAVDLWHKDIAPSTELRKWFSHLPERWEEFRERYYAELKNNTPAVELLKAKEREGLVTLLFSSRDENRNSALALKHFLEKNM